MSAKPAEAGRGEVDSARGWAVVLATFVSTFVAFGLLYSFGTFFGSMAQEFDVGRGATAFMFSVVTTIYFLLGVVAGRLGDRFGPTPLLVVAAITAFAGMFATSKVDSIWLGYVTYGVGLGIAVSCAYVPMVAFVGGWFRRRRTAALGVAVSGIGVGTLVTAPIAQSLIDAYGWRTSFVILGAVGAVLLLGCALLAAKPPTPPTDEPVRTIAQFVADRDFVKLYVCGVLLATALFVPFVFIKDFAVGQGIPASRAAILVGLIGGASVIGRLGIGALGGRRSVLLLTQGCFVTMTLSQLLWLFAGSSFTMLVIFTVVMGVGYGGYIALMPALLASIFGPVGLGGTLGLLYTSAGFGGLVGPVAIGALIDATSYDVGIIVTAVLLALSTWSLLLVDRHRAMDR
ncbi:MFS transporter [Epidermidibacterium keratini]|uniref:MFS transporter n=1 Tax=Epidermidibacterium keratini TaxID=1891644 RepID=A0A7L4YKU6_9ACTN|nr:MFS transporter [Epidermidibacterium keratini]QHB99894.1 MFS transporter [Epidermidibacterium keratini]